MQLMPEVPIDAPSVADDTEGETLLSLARRMRKLSERQERFEGEVLQTLHGLQGQIVALASKFAEGVTPLGDVGISGVQQRLSSCRQRIQLHPSGEAQSKPFPTSSDEGEVPMSIDVGVQAATVRCPQQTADTNVTPACCVAPATSVDTSSASKSKRVLLDPAPFPAEKRSRLIHDASKPTLHQPFDPVRALVTAACRAAAASAIASAAPASTSGSDAADADTSSAAAGPTPPLGSPCAARVPAFTVAADARDVVVGVGGDDASVAKAEVALAVEAIPPAADAADAEASAAAAVKAAASLAAKLALVKAPATAPATTVATAASTSTAATSTATATATATATTTATATATATAAPAGAEGASSSAAVVLRSPSGSSGHDSGASSSTADGRGGGGGGGGGGGHGRMPGASPLRPTAFAAVGGGLDLTATAEAQLEEMRAHAARIDPTLELDWSKQPEEWEEPQRAVWAQMQRERRRLRQNQLRHERQRAARLHQQQQQQQQQLQQQQLPHQQHAQLSQSQAPQTPTSTSTSAPTQMLPSQTTPQQPRPPHMQPGYIMPPSSPHMPPPQPHMQMAPPPPRVAMSAPMMMQPHMPMSVPMHQMPQPMHMGGPAPQPMHMQPQMPIRPSPEGPPQPLRHPMHYPQPMPGHPQYGYYEPHPAPTANPEMLHVPKPERPGWPTAPVAYDERVGAYDERVGYAPPQQPPPHVPPEMDAAGHPVMHRLPSE